MVCVCVWCACTQHACVCMCVMCILIISSGDYIILYIKLINSDMKIMTSPR